ncbi:MAG: hypothetical protein Q9228_006978 [Teloschistes exilis]
MTNINTMYDALKRELKPKGRSDGFAEAMHQFSDLSFDQFRDVKSYVKEFKALLKVISDSGCHLPLMFVNTQFIMRLSPSYEHLLKAAKENGMIVPEDDQQMASLDQVICLALAFEQLKKSKRTVPADFEPYSIVINDERFFSGIVSHCTRCNKDRHDQHDCWLLHPELKNRQRKRKADEMKENEQEGGEQSNDESECNGEDERSSGSSNGEDNAAAGRRARRHHDERQYDERH